MGWIKIILNIVLFVLVVAAIFYVSKKPNPRRALIWGGVLVFFGLGGSLFINLDTTLTAPLLSYLTNICLLVAGLGGNFIVGAAVMQSVRISGTLSGNIEAKIFDPNNGTTKIGELKGTVNGKVIQDSPLP